MNQLSSLHLKNIRFAPGTFLAIVLALLPVLSVFSFGGNGLFGRLIITVLFLLAAIAWMFTTPRIHRSFTWRNVDLVLILFLGVALVSLFTTPILLRSLETLSLLLLGIVLFFVSRSVGEIRYLHLMTIVIVLGGVVLAGASLWSFTQESGGLFRPYGPLKNPDGLGPALLFPFLFSFNLIAQATNRHLKLAWAVVLFVLGSTILLTASIASFVGLLAAGLLGLFVGFRLSRQTLTIGLVTILLASVAAFVTRSAVTKAPLIVSASGFQLSGIPIVFKQRLSFVQSSIAMASDHPFTGVGLGTWADHFPQYPRSLVERTELAHGYLPEILGELGWPGITVFLIFFILLLWAMVRAVRSPTAPLFLRYAALGVIALGIAGLIDIGWFYPSIFLSFWIFAGMATAPGETLVESRKSMRTIKSTVIVITIVLVGWGALRSATTYLVNEAERSAHLADYVDASSTAELVMKLLPAPDEELRATSIMFVAVRTDSDLEAARKYAEETLAHNPLQPASYLLLGRLTEREDRARAEELFRKGLALDPHFVPDLAVDLAKLLLADKRYAEAKTIANTMIDGIGGNVPKRSESLSNLHVLSAIAALELGERPEAHERLLAALKEQPTNEQARALLKEAFSEEL